MSNKFLQILRKAILKALENKENKNYGNLEELLDLLTTYINQSILFLTPITFLILTIKKGIGILEERNKKKKHIIDFILYTSERMEFLMANMPVHLRTQLQQLLVLAGISNFETDILKFSPAQFDNLRTFGKILLVLTNQAEELLKTGTASLKGKQLLFSLMFLLASLFFHK